MDTNQGNKAHQFIKIEFEWMKLIGTHEKNGESIEINHAMLFFISMINSLSQNPAKKRLTCYASNAHFADVLGVSESAISKYLKKLKKLDIIKIHEERAKGSKVTTVRYIWLQWDVINSMIAESSTDADAQLPKAGTSIEDDNTPAQVKKKSIAQPSSDEKEFAESIMPIYRAYRIDRSQYQMLYAFVKGKIVENDVDELKFFEYWNGILSECDYDKHRDLLPFQGNPNTNGTKFKTYASSVLRSYKASIQAN